MSRKRLFPREERITAVSQVIDRSRSTFSAVNVGVHENTVIKWRKQYPTNPGDTLMQVTSTDLFYHRPVGWAVSNNIDRNLMIATFNLAIKNRAPGAELIFHSGGLSVCLRRLQAR